jgi:predicted kinase
MLILVCGLIGVGKTTVAKRIVENIGGIILETNVIRNEVYPNPAYSEREIQHVYSILMKKIREGLEGEKNVILDATFYLRKNREAVIDVAKELGVGFRIVEVRCDSDEEIRRRIRNRIDDVTKTNYDEYLKIKSRFEEIKGERMIIDNAGSFGYVYEQIDGCF